MKEKIINMDGSNFDLKRETGITLIALVITIIVLLILAGVSINIVLGENGVLTKSQEAVQSTKIAEIDEQAGFISSTALTDQYQGKSFKDSVNEAVKSYTNFSVEDIDETNGIAIIVEEETGRRYEINSIYEVTYLGIAIAHTVQVGDYIAYTPTSQSYTMTISQTGYTKNQTYETSSYKGGWQVLYNDKTNGVQIISSDNILVEDTSTVLYLKGKDGYNNMVSTLNTMSGYYINPIYASLARSVGSSPSNPAGTSTYFTASPTYGHDIITWDKTYTTDEAAMETAGIKGISINYWLASRTNTSNSSSVTFSGRYMTSSGGLSKFDFGGVYSDGTSNGYSAGYGVRPVITLESNVQIDTSDVTKDGTTEERAWVLK